ncbi:MAG: hypothetical protein KUG79_00500 [Pseudomonadales bacterium]|nr:hypothetical protein [Pseudomonadales bacterium]
MWFSNAFVSQQQFQQDYWRKQAAWLTNDPSLLSLVQKIHPKYLFELCSMDLVESRLLDNQTGDLRLNFGPFELNSLPAMNMLMIQNLESVVPEVAKLLTEKIDFMPRWRIDDVMVSYANAGMSCGAHFDYYDVFLIQISGTKSWQLDTGGHTANDLCANAEVKLLENFVATQKILQNPGDILYLPPGVGHLGVASDDSITLSVGVRNPGLQEMISHLADTILDEVSGNETLDDNFQWANTGQLATSLKPGSGGIPVTTTDLLQGKLAAAFLEPSLTQRWFGNYMTELRDPDLIIPPKADFSAQQITGLLNNPTKFYCHLATRLATQLTPLKLWFFVNGQHRETTATCLDWVETLEINREVDSEQIVSTQENIDLLLWLLNSGAIYYLY